MAPGSALWWPAPHLPFIGDKSAAMQGVRGILAAALASKAASATASSASTLAELVWPLACVGACVPPAASCTRDQLQGGQAQALPDAEVQVSLRPAVICAVHASISTQTTAAG